MTDRIRRLLCRWLGHQFSYWDYLAFEARLELHCGQWQELRCRRCREVLERARHGATIGMTPGPLTRRLEDL